MSALFHAFHLCQLWTVYCEQAALTSDEPQLSSLANILDFWARVTPAILQLLSHSKVVRLQLSNEISPSTSRKNNKLHMGSLT